MKIFAFGLAHETLYLKDHNQFISINDFKECYWSHQQKGKHGNPPNYWAIALQCWYELAEKYNDQYDEGIVTAAIPSGPLLENDYHKILNIIRQDLQSYQRKSGLPDVVMLNLHGAMASELSLDCEGDIINLVRDCVGPNVSISVLLDPHAHITKKMLSLADLIMCYREYPHTDVFQVATQLYQLSKKAVETLFQPKLMTFEPCMLTHMMTKSDPMKTIVKYIQQVEGKNGIEAVTIAHGFPWANVPDIGLKVLVLYDANNKNAEHLSVQLTQAIACVLYQVRYQAKSSWMPLERALSILDQENKGNNRPVVFSDYADNPGGGANSCSTFLVHELIASKFKGSAAFALFYDPESVEFLLKKNKGDCLRISVAGNKGVDNSRYDGEPLDLEVEVIGIQTQNLHQDFSGALWPSGRAISIKILSYFDDNGEKISFKNSIDHDGKMNKEIYLVLNDKRSQVFSPSCFSAVGIDPKKLDLLVVKSMHHYRAGFSNLASRFENIASSGVLNPDFTKIKYSHIGNKEMWPLAEKVSEMEKLCEKIPSDDNQYYAELNAEIAKRD